MPFGLVAGAPRGRPVAGGAADIWLVPGAPRGRPMAGGAAGVVRATVLPGDGSTGRQPPHGRRRAS